MNTPHWTSPPRPASPPRPGIGAVTMIAAGLVLLPWLIVLATTLPSSTTVPRWSIAWVGVDSLEAAGLLAAGLLAIRGDRRHPVAAAAAAAVLTVDAWLDVVTAKDGGEFVTALIMAVGAELPLAVLCMVSAIRACGPPSPVPADAEPRLSGRLR
ncbi:hypothetical protein ACIA8C_35150 [Nocardia sp. NPDC051321]|uniref:hypothetical protein n=1 Tax=Nocardia sp. NPDC051321 TaxID=3364323 RepID=UPI0037BCA085